jgi:hypothetical protein
MKTRSGKSRGWAMVLVAIGVLALYGGSQRLVILVPAAILVWYLVVESTPRDHRN